MKSILLKLSKLLSVRMLAIGLTFIQTIVITRVFGSEVFGLLSIALSVSALLVLILSAGLDQVLMRDIARIGKHRIANSKRWQSIWRLVKYYIIPLVSFVVLIGVLLVTFTNVFNEYSLTILAAILMLPFVLSRKYLESICLGTKQVVRSITGSQLVYPVLMIIACIYVWYMGINPDVKSVSLTYVFAILGSLIASILMIKGTLKSICKKNTNSISKDDDNADLFESLGDKALLKSGMHFSLVSLGFVLGQHIDVLLTGLLSTPENVALVRISARVAEVAGLMRAIILMQYKPIIAEAYGKSDDKVLQNHISTMVKIFVFTGIPITLILFIFAEQVMMVFGPEFILGANVMRIYLIGVVFLLLCGPCNSTLALTGNEQKASKYIWIAISINILLDIILIPIWGALGCAIANATSMVILGIISVSAVRRILHIETSILIFFKLKRY
ncbi:oligosaccharide flippase family protein [Pseudocolwellia agarivorans]|uniref:oligosaccharide flippase family protein n=1 Tax=Pseudocolwellia agarivorans TaxID=1911682 RepID=UPI000986FD0A|nr:oligosaccharide flippase family protein [Pseudocolwellia agarivorans]